MDLILLFILIIGIGAVILLLIRKKESGGEDKMGAMMERLNGLSEQNRELRNSLDRKLSEAHNINQESLKNSVDFTQRMHNQSVRQVADITEKLTKLEETNKQVMNFSAQLQNLQDILKNPKQRGILGEYFLEETLKNVLPPNSYQMQYGFKNGDIVDAVVFVKDKIVPIDSKFSLENYERIINAPDQAEREKFEKLFKQDLKNRIDETSKYIKPDEGTMEFAFMFIPSEAIYYDLLINKVGVVQINTRSMIEYAFCEKHVVIVSPTSFLAYLQTVLQGLRAMQIEESAKEIRGNVEKLGKHIVAFDEFMRKLGNNVATTVNTFNTASKELAKIDKDVVRITNGEKTIEPMTLDKPQLDD